MSASELRIAPQSRTLVQLFARKGRAGDLAMALLASHGLTLPAPGYAATGGEVTALWIQPECWLLSAPRGVEGALAGVVKASCGDAGSVIDQTHGRLVLRLSGPGAPRALGRLCRIDLHPRAFGPGRVAATPVAELHCILHQVDDAPSYDVFAPATFAGSFREMLAHATTEFAHSPA